ncbi:MAG: dihydroorotate dehydrogenase [Ignavibacteria bacterium GWA2_55_11]|nr:MAG: dihydroorotate dehydrogenase [Ignavibacteria bacterium GWA2_55_11]OGU43635.1 MAG: dihydroorotate dehydrogenase [Ignavibacteria bacterium GWC2_56_12]OGU69914.1 MAG: dihydroorotate dehydrogenase [Ignavibacteria bacterium RIFCSPLOWO2_02_FULL_55_14]OGU76403.1 MAG: dihydroorotate dehydrogenase [Ignavibacteria bacterium RIFCSPLOWO2_12_FULL_56_21]
MDLTTYYLGKRLKNPIVPSASPLSRNIDMMRRMEDAGAAAIVMYSLFEEQIEHESFEIDHYLSYGTQSYAEALTYFPEAADYNLEPDQYLELLRKAAQSLDIPVIASLNGVSKGGWIKYAKHLEEAGADAIELNVYYIPTDPVLAGDDVETRYLDILHAVKSTVAIPVAVKLSPYFTAMANMAQRLVNAGADGLTLFNRFYQPDIDINEMEVVPSIHLSDSSANRLAMRWIAILHGKIKASLAATGGIHSSDDVVKLLMAGADVTMMASALLKKGPEHIADVLRDLEKWMFDHEYTSVEQMKGSVSHRSVRDPSAFERANYMKALNKYKLLV